MSSSTDLRRQAENWRAFATIVTVLGIIGAAVIAWNLASLNSYLGESDRDWAVFFGTFIGWTIAILLVTGLFFLLTALVEGVAEMTDSINNLGNRTKNSPHKAKSAGPPEVSAPTRTSPNPVSQRRATIAPAPPPQESYRPTSTVDCPSCDRAIAPGTMMCPYCKTRLSNDDEEGRCPDCGAHTRLTASGRCPDCAARLGGLAPSI